MKVNNANIIIPKVKPFEVTIGQEYEHREKNKGVFVVTQIDVEDQATFISVIDENGKDTTYGSKAFSNMYKLKG